MLGKGKVASQFKQVGYYASIELHLVKTEIPGVEINFGTCPKNFKAGIEFGVAYAIDIGQRNGFHAIGYQVNLSLVHSNPVDTTDLLMAYASALAILDALNIPVPLGMKIAPENGQVIFCR